LTHCCPAGDDNYSSLVELIKGNINSLSSQGGVGGAFTFRIIFSQGEVNFDSSSCKPAVFAISLKPLLQGVCGFNIRLFLLRWLTTGVTGDGLANLFKKGSSGESVGPVRLSFPS